MPPIRLGVGIPCTSNLLDIGHAAMWFGVGAQMSVNPDKFELTSFANYTVNGIDLARNFIVADALAAHCDWVLMVDADVFHTTTAAGAIGDAGSDILQMILDGHRADVAAIGAPVRGRNVGDDRELMMVHGRHGNAYPRLTLGDIAGQVLPVARIATAFLGVNCNWLREYWPAAPWFAFVHDYQSQPWDRLGEDYYLCDGIHARGGTILCDGRFVPEHVAGRRLAGK